MTPGLRPILWDIYEEHFDEAAFLWGQWERALVAANYTLQQVVDGPEERLLAHLDGLVLGGKRVAEKLLLSALGDDDAGKVFAAAWSLIQAEDADHLETVFDALPKAKPPARAALGRALELSTGRADLPKRLIVLWDKSEAPVRGVLLDALAGRDPKWATTHLARCLGESDATLQSAALRALRRAPDVAHPSRVEELLRSEDATVRQEAMATGYVMRVRWLWDACRREAEGPSDACRLPLALLALEGDAADRAFLMGRLALPEARRHVLWALGFLGDVETVEVLVAALDDEKVARVAGESLTAITGMVIAGSLVKPGTTKGPGVEDVRPDDQVPEALPEDLLLVPAAPAVRSWWAGAKGRFRVGMRYWYGDEPAWEGRRDVAMWRRAVVSLALAASKREGTRVDPRTWARGAR